MKWSVWLTPDVPIPTPTTGWDYIHVVGLYDGAKYSRGCYKPEIQCMMSNSQSNYCRICTEALVKRIHESVIAIESTYPQKGPALYALSDTYYSVSLLDPANIQYKVQWFYDYKLVPESTAAHIVLHPWRLGTTMHVLQCVVTDTTWYTYKQTGIADYPTRFVRNDPNSVMSDTVTWWLRYSLGADIQLAESQPGINSSSMTVNFLGRNIGYGSKSVESSEKVMIYDMQGRLVRVVTRGDTYRPAHGAYIVRRVSSRHLR